MAVQIDHRPHYTYRDYVHWEGRWELIQGLPYAMSPQPSIRHQVVSQRISVELERALQGCDACQALLPVDWKVEEDTVLQPDNLVVCGEVEGQYLTEAPVLVFEVLSPSTAFKDREVKFALYEAAGVRHYVLVEPIACEAEVFTLEEGRYEQRADAIDAEVDFDLGARRILFDFTRLW